MYILSLFTKVTFVFGLHFRCQSHEQPGRTNRSHPETVDRTPKDLLTVEERSLVHRQKEKTIQKEGEGR